MNRTKFEEVPQKTRDFVCSSTNLIEGPPSNILPQEVEHKSTTGVDGGDTKRLPRVLSYTASSLVSFHQTAKEQTLNRMFEQAMPSEATLVSNGTWLVDRSTSRY